MQVLLQFQRRVPVGGLPVYGPERMRAELEAFAVACVRCELAREWNGDERALWNRVVLSLVDSAQAQPRIAVRAGGAGRAYWPAATDRDAVAGPLTFDLAALLRDGGLAVDESDELDLAVRWWEAARQAGLPVDPDFGECWRALEWMGLQHQLTLAGQECLVRLERATPADPSWTQGLQGRLQAVNRVALRYGPLKPLLRLLPTSAGAAPSAGYTF